MSSPTFNPLAEAYRIVDRISDLKEEISRLQAEHDDLLKVAAENNLTTVDGYRLVQEVSRRRTVNVGRVRDLFPDQYHEIVSASNADLVRILGKQSLVSVARASKPEEFERVASITVADAKAALGRDLDQVVDYVETQKPPRVVRDGDA